MYVVVVQKNGFFWNQPIGPLLGKGSLLRFFDDEAFTLAFA